MDKYLIKLDAKPKNDSTPEQKMDVKKETPKQKNAVKEKKETPNQTKAVKEKKETPKQAKIVKEKKETPKQANVVKEKKETPKQAKAAKEKPAATKKRKNQETEEEEFKNKDKENAVTENPPKRRSGRSTRSTRSMADDGSPSPEKVPKKSLPFIKYNGAIKYYTEQQEIAASADEVMQWVEKQEDDVVPMAFDMEWPFSFQTGPGKSAVIQICVIEDCCYVYQLTKLTKIPAALVALINHPKVRLHGLNIKADFRKLQRDFPEVAAEPLIEKCVDLGVWCNQVCETGGRWSLERLANHITKQAMDKSKKVRMSKWHVIPLDANQLMYASIDVYIGQVIYREIEKREKLKLKNEAEFKEQNGDDAFKAVKALGNTFLSKINEVTI